MIKIICGGKKSVGWVAEGAHEYTKRLRKPFDVEWVFVAEERLEETVRKLNPRTLVILLDERGEMLDSPGLQKKISGGFEAGREVVFVIGGAFGFTEVMRTETIYSFVSLSKLVFPHQICRLLLAEQIYRAQEIYLGRPYHHA